MRYASSGAACVYWHTAWYAFSFYKTPLLRTNDKRPIYFLFHFLLLCTCIACNRREGNAKALATILLAVPSKRGGMVAPAFHACARITCLCCCQEGYGGQCVLGFATAVPSHDILLAFRFQVKRPVYCHCLPIVHPCVLPSSLSSPGVYSVCSSTNFCSSGQ